MGKAIVVTSGKGGVGKTTIDGGARRGPGRQWRQVSRWSISMSDCAISISSWAPSGVSSSISSMSCRVEAKLAQAMIRDKRLPRRCILLPASQTRDKDALTPKTACEQRDRPR